jgi:rhomboid protease GluP
MVLTGISIMEPGPRSLIAWGANYGPLTLSGQWWRLVTGCFVHIGVMHLLMNAIALLFIGLLLEPKLGRMRFAWAYLLTGVGGSVNSLWWHGYTISAGASGAIFGLYGVFLALLTTRLVERKFRRVQLAFMLFFVVYNLVNGVKGNIDNAAHTGGFFCGLLLGYAYLPGLKKPGSTGSNFAVALASAIILAVSWLAYGKIPDSMGRYESGMKTFSAQETKALTVYGMPPESGDARLLQQIKDTGIYYWQKNARLVTELDKLHLPPALHLRNEKLLRYCDLRIRCYELFFRSVNEHTGKYQGQMEDYNRQIERVLQELKE